MQPNEISIHALTVDEFCRAYCIGRTMAYAEMAAGRLIARKAGSRTIIVKSDADDWLSALPQARAQGRLSARNT